MNFIVALLGTMRRHDAPREELDDAWMYTVLDDVAVEVSVVLAPVSVTVDVRVDVEVLVAVLVIVFVIELVRT